MFTFDSVCGSQNSCNNNNKSKKHKQKQRNYSKRKDNRKE